VVSWRHAPVKPSTSTPRRPLQEEHMTETRPNDETRKRFEQLLEAKKAARKSADTTSAADRGSATHLPGAKSGKSFKRRKV
jgi:hypothetical protein